MAYSPIASMKYQWTINLHDGYPPLQVLLPEEYIPPSLHNLCNFKPTMFHLCDDYLCPYKILLRPGDNEESLLDKVTIKWLRPLKRQMGNDSKTPPSLHNLCNFKPNMFHLGDDYLCQHKILLRLKTMGREYWLK